MYRLHEIESIEVRRRHEWNLFGHTLEVNLKFKGENAETFAFGSNRKPSKAFFEALRYLSTQTEVRFDLPEGELYDFVRMLR